MKALEKYHLRNKRYAKRWIGQTVRIKRNGESIVYRWYEIFTRWLRMVGRVNADKVRWFNHRFIVKHELHYFPDGLAEYTRDAVRAAQIKGPWHFNVSFVPRPPSMLEKNGYVAGLIGRKLSVHPSVIPVPLIEAKLSHLKVVREIKERSK